MSKTYNIISTTVLGPDAHHNAYYNVRFEARNPEETISLVAAIPWSQTISTLHYLSESDRGYFSLRELNSDFSIALTYKDLIRYKEYMIAESYYVETEGTSAYFSLILSASDGLYSLRTKNIHRPLALNVAPHFTPYTSVKTDDLVLFLGNGVQVGYLNYCRVQETKSLLKEAT